MKMAQLSARSGVGAPTIRYYIREGLVPAGELTSPNQASYDETHLRALRLVRALIDVGGLSIEDARQVLAHLSDDGGDVLAVLGSVQHALTPQKAEQGGEPAAVDAATQRVDELIASRWWTVGADNPARAALARTLVSLDEIGVTEVGGMLDAYAAAAEELAEQEVEALATAPTPQAAVVRTVAFDVLGDRVLSCLRRLAQEDARVARDAAARAVTEPDGDGTASRPAGVTPAGPTHRGASRADLR